MRLKIEFSAILVVLVVLISGSWQLVAAGANVAAEDPPPVRHSVYLPLATSGALPTVDWDPRLTQRGAEIVPAEVESGESYWRLVKAVWYDENEPPVAGQHHIFIDTLDAMDERHTGVPVLIRSIWGPQDLGTVYTEAKPGELYAANWPMWEVAPCYSATPVDGVPADGVTNMGMGSIGLPTWKIHTSYGLIWKWTVAP